MSANEFEIKVLPIQDKLFRFACRLMNNAQEAEDIIQDVFLKLWKNRLKLAQYRSLDAFAMTMTKNACYDKLKSARHKSVQVDYSNLNLLETQNPYELTEQGDSLNLMKKALNKLPEDQKMIVQLRDIEGYEFKEIADILEIRPETIRVKLSRARKKMRSVYAQIHSYGIE